MYLHRHVAGVQREVSLQTNGVYLNDRQESIVVVCKKLECLLQRPVRGLLNPIRVNQIVQCFLHQVVPVFGILTEDRLNDEPRKLILLMRPLPLVNGSKQRDIDVGINRRRHVFAVSGSCVHTVRVAKTTSHADVRGQVFGEHSLTGDVPLRIIVTEGALTGVVDVPKRITATRREEKLRDTGVSRF